MRVVLDTNALMMPVEVGVRTFEELDRLLGDHETVVPRAVLDELDDLAEGNGEEAKAASVGADLARRECEPIEHEAAYADDAVLEIAREVDGAVTNDMPLRRRLLDENVPVISLRGRNKLEVTQP
ncbi:twitching motility protein PilT [Natronomonas gomsonensis]|jgi:rRNA-processing protein FCF1|uniref:PIN domain-containing protein n=1 Tax=Natronomonas gomsonensis TaxID=1046043 RepID=UPI0020CA91EA|nr:PIN domain-containing protein [Natronomonas gomsonensis]MCY4730989.1 twitching motility protein PilT [Natronomonas gomsonensis]